MEKSFTFFQWNCRSLGKNLSYLIQHLTEAQYDILLLQALNLTLEKAPKITGYYFPPVTSNSKPEDRLQTAIYIKLGLKYTHIEIPSVKDLGNIHLTAIAIQISKNSVINTASVYLPKGPIENNTDWIKTLDTKVLNKGKWVIGGDFNAHSSL